MSPTRSASRLRARPTSSFGRASTGSCSRPRRTGSSTDPSRVSGAGNSSWTRTASTTGSRRDRERGRRQRLPRHWGGSTMNRTSLIAASVFAASLVPARAWADLTADLCGKVSSRGGTITSEGVKTSFHIDTVEGRTTPVPHCFIHGTVAEDSAFLVQLPANWNGKYVLQMGGGVGGSEVAGEAFLLLPGYCRHPPDHGPRAAGVA